VVREAKLINGTYPFPFDHLWAWTTDMTAGVQCLPLSLSLFLGNALDYAEDKTSFIDFNKIGIDVIHLANNEQYPELAEAVLLTILHRSISNNKPLEPWSEIGGAFRIVIGNSNPDFINYLLELCIGFKDWWESLNRDPLTSKKLQRIIWMAEKNSNSKVLNKVSSISQHLENKAVLSRNEANDYVCGYLSNSTFNKLSDTQRNLLIDAETQFRKSQRQGPENMKEKEYWNEVANAPFLAIEDLMRTALQNSFERKYNKKPPELGKMLFSILECQRANFREGRDYEVALGQELLSIFPRFDDKKMIRKFQDLNNKFRNFASHNAYPIEGLAEWRKRLYLSGMLRDLFAALVAH